MKKNSILLITGGTGSFGQAVLNKNLDNKNIKEIRILSRDEEKQDLNPLHEYQISYPIIFHS